MEKRVVITGLGAISPIGNNVNELWDGIKKCKCGIDEITAFDTSTFKTYQDLYIINEATHQIYYPKGVNYNVEIYFTKGNNAESINKIENISARFKQN